MSSSEKETPSPGLGAWPKVILWSLVFVFGVLYLSSGKRQPEVSSSTAVVEPPSAALQGEAPEAPATTRATGAEGSGASPVAGGDSAAGEGPMERATEVGGEPEPLRAAESAVFADSLLAREPAGAPDGTQGAAADVPPPPMSGVEGRPADSGPEAAEPLVSVGPTPPVPIEAAPVEAAPQVSVGPTPPAPTEGPTKVSVGPRPAAPAEGAPLDAGQDEGAGRQVAESREAERARILAEYEALRRAAEAERLRSWTPGVPTPPAFPPYWQPSYGPAYGPGGYPAR